MSRRLLLSLPHSPLASPLASRFAPLPARPCHSPLDSRLPSTVSRRPPPQPRPQPERFPPSLKNRAPYPTIPAATPCASRIPFRHWNPLRVRAVRRQFPRLPVVLQARLQQRHQSQMQLRILDRHRAFHATVEVARHPVRRADEILRLRIVREIPDARVLEEPPDDADHADTVGQPLDLRPQAADPAHDQVDLHAGLRRAVERLDHLRVHQRVHLHDDARRPPGRGVLRLALHQLQEPLAHRRAARRSACGRLAGGRTR